MMMKKLIKNIARALMASLGFAAASCDKIHLGKEEGGEMMVMYGVPYATYTSKGSVTDNAGNALKNIVVTRHGEELTATDTDGNFSIKSEVVGFGRDTLVLNFHDVDGPENGGSFTTTQATVKLTKTSDGDKNNSWFLGEYTGSDVKVVMKKQD